MPNPDQTNTGLRVESSTRDGGVVIRPMGDIDLTGSPTLRVELRRAAGEKPQRLVIDLADVGYMDSSGVATLVEAMQITRRNSTALVLCNMQPRVRSIFEIARLHSVFRIEPTLDAAMK